MEIAREIAEAVQVAMGWNQCEEAFMGQMEDAIAAKLKPVRDTILHVLSEEQPVLGKQSQNDLAEALALFEEEA